MSVSPPRIAFFERRPPVRRIQVYLTIALVGLASVWRFRRLQRELSARGAGLTASDLRRYRLLRRYAAGAAAGDMAARYGLGPSGTPGERRIYSDIAALWSNFLIAADAAMDAKAVSRDQGSALLRRCFDALVEPAKAALPPEMEHALAVRHGEIFGPFAAPPGYPAGAEFRFERYAVATAAGIGRNVALLQGGRLATQFPQALATALNEFLGRALDLADGQLASLEQRLVDEQHDWGWYRDISDKKNVNVLLSPFSLLVNPAAPLPPYESVRRCFLLINRSFFHRQVLDDLLDFEEDLSNGTANALIYMVVGQGRIADAAANGGINVLRELKRSGMLMPEFDVGCPVPDQWDIPDQWPALVRAALVNHPAERDIPLDHLVAECRRRKDALLRAWAGGDRAAIEDIVRRSGIATRILHSIAAGRSQPEIEQALRALPDESMREVLYLFYLRTLQTYRRCVGKWS